MGADNLVNWHARIGFSSAERWTNCTASVIASEGYPRQDSKFSREGVLCHHYGASWLKTGVRPSMPELDKEMRTCVSGYVAEALEVAKDAEIIVEVSVLTVPEIHPEVGGTPDLLLLHHRLRMLEIVDFKSGVSTVSPKALQLAGYAIAAYFEHSYFKPETIRRRIIQPRGGGAISRHVTQPTQEFLDAYLPMLRKGAREAMGPNPQFKPGAWCWYCPHRPDCKARKDFVRNKADTERGKEFDNE